MVVSDIAQTSFFTVQRPRSDRKVKKETRRQLPCFGGFALVFACSWLRKGLRILQDFAAICRAILLKLFRISATLATHTPQVLGSSPRAATNVQWPKFLILGSTIPV